MNTCPCCSEPLLRHIRRNSVYWFCPRCWQIMPLLDAVLNNINSEFQTMQPLSEALSQPRSKCLKR